MKLVSYLAIARKYRPATFDEIVGQDHVTQTLKNAIALNRIHHAFLFTGARGVGKTTAARALARSLNCENGPTANPCGTCTNCMEVASGSNPDLIEIDGASNNSVEDVREIREAVRYAPSRGGWKIYLIDEVHMLSKGAFNALLKTLEEPPPHILFIFATTEPHKIPDTILSRVQRFDFKRIPVPTIVQRLSEIAKSEEVTLTESGFRMIATAGAGSMRDAQSLLDQVISYAGSDISDQHVIESLGLIDRSMLYGMVEALLTGQPDQGLDLIQQAYAAGYDLVRFSEELLEVFRNATFIRLSKGARKHVDLPSDECTRLEQLTQNATAQQLSRLFAALLEVHDQTSRSNRPKVILEMSILRLTDIRPVQPLRELIDRLEALEKKLGPGQPPPRGGTGQPRNTSRGDVRSTTGTTGSQAGAPRALKKEQTAAAPQVSVAARPTHLKLVTAVPSEEAVPEISQPLPELPPVAPPVASPKSETPTPWASFRARLQGIDRSVETLLGGKPSFADGILTIGCKAGADVARARRGMQNPRVLKALHASYGHGTTLEISSIKALAPGAVDLNRHPLANHPGIKLLVDVLDANIEEISQPKSDGEEL